MAEETFESGDRVTLRSGATGTVHLVGTTTFMEGVREPAVWVDLDGHPRRSQIVRPDDLARI